MEKKVLFITSDFLPNRNGGTIRLEKLIKYFPGQRIIPFVLTRRSGFSIGPEHISGATVYRTSNRDLFEWGLKLISGIKKTFRRKDSENNKSERKQKATQEVTNARFADNWVAPDTDVFWALGSVYRAYKIIKKQKIDVVYSSSPSSSVHILGLLIKIALPRIKWITEYRDPWTFNPFRYPKPYLFEKLDHLLEKKCTRRADHLIVVSAYFKELFLEKYKFLNEQQIDVIPNGYDLEDFDFLKPDTENTGTMISIVHTGSFYEKRSLSPLVEALYEVEKEDPGLSSRLKFIQYGKIDPKAVHFLDANAVKSAVFFQTVSHRESLGAMFGADWLLLIPGPGKGTMTGKIFEYIVARKPILILADEGPAKQIVEDHKLGICLSPEDKSGIKDFIFKISNGFKFDIVTDLDKSELRNYDRRVIAGKVLEVIENA